MLDVILSQLATGLVLGGLYVLIAIGLSIIFGLLGIVNFAHGSFFALGAYFALTLYEYFGWPAVMLAPLLVGVVGMVVERMLIHRLYDKEPLISLIVTFALALMIEALLRLIYGGIGQPFNQPPFLSGIYLWGPLLITKYRLTVFLITVALLVGAVGLPAIHPVRPHPARGLARSGDGGAAGHQPAARADRGVRPWLRARRGRRAAGRAAMDGHPVDVGERDHAGLRRRGDRRPRVFRGRGDRRAAGRGGDGADHPVPAGCRGRRDVCVHGDGAAAAPTRFAGRAVGAVRMSAALRHPILWVFVVLIGLTVAWNAIGAPISLITADRHLHAVRRRGESAGGLHRPGAVRRLGVLRLRQLCRRDL